MYGVEKKMWEHMLERCAKWNEDEESLSMEGILEQGGGERGNDWMRRQLRIRGEALRDDEEEWKNMDTRKRETL